VLREEARAGVLVHVCPDCRGLWLSPGELNALVQPQEGDLEYCSEDRPGEDRPTELRCPQCPDQELVQVRFAAYSGIALDLCRSCRGLWLEREALTAITREVRKLERMPDDWTHRLMLFLSKLPF